MVLVPLFSAYQDDPKMEPDPIDHGHDTDEGKEDTQGEHNIPVPTAKTEQDDSGMLGDGNPGNMGGEERADARDYNKIDRGILQVFVPYLPECLPRAE
jgi:hypothetical protein